MEHRRRVVVLPSAFVAVTLSACGAEPHDVVLASERTGADQGGVLVAYSPTQPTLAGELAHLTTDAGGTPISVWIDGRPAMLQHDSGHLAPFTVVEGGISACGYLDAGPHHLAVAAPGHSAPIFEGDAEVPSGGTMRLFLFGALEALQGRFVPTPDRPAAGNEHLTVINLVRTGQSLEVVTCAGAASCTPLSDPLALGDVFDLEVPAPVEHPTSTLTADGAGIGYRVVPSEALPAPPVMALDQGQLTMSDAEEASPSPAVFVVAPIYISDDGQPTYGFD